MAATYIVPILPRWAIKSENGAQGGDIWDLGQQTD